MRLNRYVANATGISRRGADDLIYAGKVKVDGVVAKLGQVLVPGQKVTLDNKLLELPEYVTIILNKPLGIVVSRNGQGSKTIYDILPKEYANLKPVGRLDKDSSGLLVMTNDGDLANRLAHPSENKTKEYSLTLSKPLSEAHEHQISNKGVLLEDGLSKFKVIPSVDRKNIEVIMSEGRNRQIRRTFAELGYQVKTLNRHKFANFNLGAIKPGGYKVV